MASANMPDGDAPAPPDPNAATNGQDASRDELPAAEPSAPSSASVGAGGSVRPAGEARHIPPSRGDWIHLAWVAGASAVADIASKNWATKALNGFEPLAHGPKEITVVPGFFDIIFTLNPGGAWSFLRGLPEYYRRPFFLFVSAAAMVFMVQLYARAGHRLKGMRWGLPLALGGALGNLVDRIRYGSVVDFLDLYFTRGGSEHHWPTFNVADVAIVVGVVLMAFDMLFGPRLDESEGGAPERDAVQVKATETSDGKPDAAVRTPTT